MIHVCCHCWCKCCKHKVNLLPPCCLFLVASARRQGSQKSFKSGQGNLEKDLHRLSKELSKLRSAHDMAAKEQRGIKALVDEVEGKVQEVRSTSTSSSDDLFLQPVSAQQSFT